MSQILPRTMRAVVCPSAPIPPSGLTYTTQYPTPSPKPGHVLIRVKAFGVNRSELFTRQDLAIIPPSVQFPKVLGVECVGVVQDAGGNDKWAVGDVVAAIVGGMGRQFDGGYAEYTLIPQKNVSPPVKLPQNMSWAQFGAIPETFMTAWGTLAKGLKLQPTDTLLIRGGTTSVGLACAALAKSSLFGGSARVLSTTRAEAKVARVLATGADEVLIDGKDGVHAAVKNATGGRGADKVVELVGGTTLQDSCRAMADDGVCAFVGCVSNKTAVQEFNPLMSLAPYKFLTMFSSGTVDLSSAPLQWIVDAVAEGRIPVNLDRVFKMEDVGDAHAYMEANSAAGKVVCLLDEE